MQAWRHTARRTLSVLTTVRMMWRDRVRFFGTTTRVLPSGGVARQDVDIAYRETLKARAREDAAASTLRLETQRRQEGIREARAALARANANLESAQVRLEQRIVTTPHAGEVLQIRFPDPKRQFFAEVISVGRRMGRKNVRTDDPTERNDTKILEVVLAVREVGDFIIGERVDGYLQVRQGMLVAGTNGDEKRAARAGKSP